MADPRIVLVTGAARGIGRGIAAAFVANGDTVVLADCDGAVVQAAHAMHADARIADIADEAQVAALIAGIVADYGGVDVLISNAGLSIKHDGASPRILATSLPEWNAMMAVNVTAAFLLAKACIPVMAACGGGRIIAIGSQGGRAKPEATSAAYAASKAGLIGLMRALANETAAAGITANYIAPGVIETPMMGAFSAETQARVLARIPVGRSGRPADIASAAVFLASLEASFITGAILDVNGGMFMP